MADFNQLTDLARKRAEAEVRQPDQGPQLPASPQPIDNTLPAGMRIEDKLNTLMDYANAQSLEMRANGVVDLANGGLLFDDDFGKAVEANNNDPELATKALLKLGTRRALQQEELKASPWYSALGVDFVTSAINSMGGIASMSQRINDYVKTSTGFDILKHTTMGGLVAPSQQQFNVQKATELLTTDMESVYFGAPNKLSNPQEYALWNEQYSGEHGMARAIASLAEFSAEMIVMNAVAPGVGSAMLGPKLSKYFVSGPVRSVIVPGASFAGGYLAGKLQGSEEPWKWGVGASAFATFGNALVSQRFFGAAARTTALGDMLAKFGPKRTEELFVRFPRLTLGALANAAVVGATLDATREAAKGSDPWTIIEKGAEGAAMWATLDIGFSRIGATARWAGINLGFQDKLANILGGLKFFKDDVQAATYAANRMRMVGMTATGAAIGAGVAGEDNRLTGALTGGALGAGAYGLQTSMLNKVAKARLDFLSYGLEDSIVTKLSMGQFNSLTPEEIAKVTAAVFQTAAKETAAGVVEEPLEHVLRQVTGFTSAELGSDEAAWHAQKRILTREIAIRENAGISVHDTGLAKMQLALGQVEQRLQQFAIQRGDRLAQEALLESQIGDAQLTQGISGVRRGGLILSPQEELLNVLKNHAEAERLRQLEYRSRWTEALGEVTSHETIPTDLASLGMSEAHELSSVIRDSHMLDEVGILSRLSPEERDIFATLRETYKLRKSPAAVATAHGANQVAAQRILDNLPGSVDVRMERLYQDQLPKIIKLAKDERRALADAIRGMDALGLDAANPRVRATVQRAVEVERFITELERPRPRPPEVGPGNWRDWPQGPEMTASEAVAEHTPVKREIAAVKPPKVEVPASTPSVAPAGARNVAAPLSLNQPPAVRPVAPPDTAALRTQLFETNREIDFLKAEIEKEPSLRTVRARELKGQIATLGEEARQLRLQIYTPAGSSPTPTPNTGPVAALKPVNPANITYIESLKAKLAKLNAELDSVDERLFKDKEATKRGRPKSSGGFKPFDAEATPAVSEPTVIKDRVSRQDKVKLTEQRKTLTAERDAANAELAQLSQPTPPLEAPNKPPFIIKRVDTGANIANVEAGEYRVHQLGEYTGVYHPIEGGNAYMRPNDPKLLRELDTLLSEAAGSRPIPPSSLGGKVTASALVTAALGSSLYDYLNAKDEVDPKDPNAPAVNRAGFDVITGIALASIMFTGWKGAKFLKGGIKLTQEEAAKRIIRPAVEDLVETSVAESLIGKPLKELRATLKMADGSTRPLTGRNVVYRMTNDQQVRHFIARAKAIANHDHLPVDKDGIKRTAEEERVHHFLANATAFFPTFLDAKDYPLVQSAFFEHAATAGLTDRAAMEAWRGLLTLSLRGPNERIATRGTDILSTLAHDGSARFGTVQGLESLREAYQALEFTTRGTWDGYRRSDLKNFRTTLMPGSARAKAVMAEIELAEKHPRVVGNDPRNVIVPVGSGMFTPTTNYIRHGMNLKSQGELTNNPAMAEMGQAIIDGATSILKTGERIRTGIDKDWAEIKPLIRDIYTREDLDLFRAAIENPEIRSSLIGVKDNIVAAVDAWGKLRARWHEQFKDLPFYKKVEDYFPWLYSQRTMNELREQMGKGQLPTDIAAPFGYGLSPAKFNKFLMPRGATPAGELADPRETIYYYIVGANRKAHLDDMIAQMGPEYWATMRKSQPHIASVLGRHFLDMQGVPSNAYLNFLGTMDKIGRFLTYANDFVPTEGLRHIAEDYFLNGAGAQIPNLIRGWEFRMKIGGSAISALINLSQLPINAGSWLSNSELFVNGLDYSANALAERLPFIKPSARGAAKLRLVRESGVLSETHTRAFDDLQAMEGLTRRPATGLILKSTLGGALTGAAIGGAAGAALDLDPDTMSASRGAYIGAAAGLLLAGKARGLTGPGDPRAAKVIQRSLETFRDTITAPFQMVEVFNRSATFLTAHDLATRTLAGATGPSRAVRAVRGGLLGAAGGAGLGYVTGGDTPESRQQAAIGGGIAGALLGGTAAAFAEPREARAARELRAIKDRRFLRSEEVYTPTSDVGPQNFQGTRMWDAAKKELLKPISEAEVATEYARQITDFTQFRMGREARGPWLRTPYGEILGALQGYTVNQAAFTGGLLKSFALSAENFKQTGVLDLRIFRHAAILAGVSGAYAATAGWMGSTKDPEYWLARIGFGLAPFMQWNDTTNTYQFTNVGQMIGGPFISDITRAANFAKDLMVDEHKRASFNRDLTRLSMQIVPALRQARDASMKLQQLQEEGILDLANPAANILKGALGAVATPGETLRPAQFNEIPTNPGNIVPSSGQ